jgi:hypothetical protein
MPTIVVPATPAVPTGGFVPATPAVPATASAVPASAAMPATASTVPATASAVTMLRRDRTCDRDHQDGCRGDE